MIFRPRAAALPAAWIVCVAAAEILGRRSPSDVWDAIGVVVFATLLGITILRVWRAGARRAGWIHRTARRARSTARGWWPEIGIDLRGEPPLPRAFPPALARALAVVVVVAALAFLGRGWLPGPGRQVALAVSPTLYFLGLALLWAGLFAMFWVGGFFAWLDLHDALWNAGVPTTRRRWVEGLSAVAWLGAVVALVALVPIWVCWTVLLAACAVGTGAAVAIDRYEPLRFLWRMNATQSPRVLTAGSGIGWNCWITAGLLLAAGLVGVGSGWAGRLAETMPITIGLGSAASWSACLAFALWVATHLARPAWLTRSDPARPRPAALRFAGPVSPSETALRRLREHGFRCFVESAPPDEGPGVTVELDRAAPAGLRAESDDSGARVRVHPERLTRPSVLAELRGLDTRLRRTSLLAGFARLLAIASERRYDKGSGFWLAPHLWYVIGMTRDEDDGDFWTIGPPYHKVFPLAARQHAHQVLRALEIDLIFTEDGVAFKDLAAVLERCFDVYDVLGPERIEEKHFTGLMRVRVLIHDFTLGEPLDREGYREPSYEEIGRARILHVMRDRGEGEEEDDPAPVTPEEEPVLTFA